MTPADRLSAAKHHGALVRITRGPFAGMTGRVERVTDGTAYVRMTSTHRLMAIPADVLQVEPGQATTVITTARVRRHGLVRLRERNAEAAA